MALYCSGFSSSRFCRDGETELVPRSRTWMFGENERKYCAMLPSDTTITNENK